MPWAFRKELNWIANAYGNPPIYVTENGFSDYGGLNDTNRVLYYTVSTSTYCKYLRVCVVGQ